MNDELGFTDVPFIDEVIFSAGTENKNKKALSIGNASLSYIALEKAVNGACHWLRTTEKLEASDRIAIHLPNSLELIVYILAALRLNITVIPINTKYNSDTVRYIFEQTEAKLILTDTNGAKLFPPQDCRVLDGLSFSDVPIWAHEKQADDLALIYYTSGSTGRPKGVMISHRNLMLAADSVSNYLILKSDDRLAAVLPLAFDAGLNFVLSGLYVGAEITFVSFILPISLLKNLRDLEITSLLLVPSVYQQISPFLDEPLPALRMCASTGGTMPTETIDILVKKNPNLSFYVMYGLTEAFRTSYLSPKDYPRKKGSIGKAIPHAEVFVVDKKGEECKPNEHGEIVHCGPLVGLGYLNDQKSTEERYRKTPYYSKYYKKYDRCVFSGDTGWKDEEGYLYFAGRADRLIKSKGFRISPEEIEKAVMEHTAYSLCYALGEDHPIHGQIVMIIVESNKVPELRIIQNQLRPYLSSFMLPEKVMSVSKIPLNSNGKVDGRALSDQLGFSP